MQWQLSPSVIIEAVTGLALLVVAVFFPWRDLNRRASLIGSVLLIIAALWILTHSLEIGTPIASYKAYLMGLQLIWGLLAMALWLMYIIQYCAPGKWQTSRIYALFSLMPLLAIAAVVTNHIYGLMWTTPGLDTHDPYLPLEPAYGPFYWVCMAYIGALTICGSFLVLKKIVRQHYFRQWEAWALILAAVLPLLVAFLEVTGLPLSAGLTIGITPFFSGIGIIIMIWSLPRFHLQKIIPSARDTVFERISDSVVVLDMQNRVVDLNPAAERLAGYTSQEARGMSVAQIWPNWPSHLVHSESSSTIYQELFLTYDGKPRAYDLRIYTMIDHTNGPLNKLALLVDITGRKQAEQELRQSEENWKFYLESAPDGVYLSDLKGTLLYGNKEAEKITGYNKEELLGKSFLELHLLSPKDLSTAIKLLALSVLGKSSGPDELELVRKDGSRIYVEINTNPVKQGGKARIIGFVRDITERKISNANLVNSENRYRRLFETAKDGILMLDVETGMVIDVNPFLVQMLGFTRDEFLGKTIWELGFLKDVIANKANFEELQNKGYVHYEALPLETAGGKRIDVEFVSNVYEVDNKKVIQCDIRDITDRKRMEDELKRKQDIDNMIHSLSSLSLEDKPLDIMLKDSLDLILSIPWLKVEAKGSIFLVKEKENTLSLCVHKQLSEYLLIKCAQVPFGRCLCGQAALSGKLQFADCLDERHDVRYESIRPHGHYCIPICFDVNVIGVINVYVKEGHTRNTTEEACLIAAANTLAGVIQRKRSEEDNRQLRDKAEMSSRLAAVGEMATGIAHEINNPLTGVIGFSEILLERHDLPADVKEEVKIIADGGKRVKDIVRRMLTFSHQTKPMKIGADINELIEATLDLRSYVLKTANIEVVKHLDPDLPRVVVDPGQIQQVFLNLTVNAEYSMKKAHDKGTLTVTTAKKDGHIRISFKDDGLGMSQETKEKLFHPFFTTKQVNEGTGLGLSLSRSIILEHNGTIEVESQPGQGATFIITLPMTQPAEEAPAEVIAATPAEKVKAIHILVVDDEEAIRKLVSMLLIKSGHTVETTGDAREALMKLESTRYDAVLMDIRMPGTSGMELYTRVKEKYPKLSSKFIFITGDTSDSTTKAFLEQNNLSYITKPFDRDTLLQKVSGGQP